MRTSRVNACDASGLKAQPLPIELVQLVPLGITRETPDAAVSMDDLLGQAAGAIKFA